MRVQVVDRPRIESTRMSSTSRCVAADWCRAFQRSRPARASASCAALETVMSGCVDVRRPLRCVPGAGRLRALGTPDDLRREGATRGGSSWCFL